MIEREFFEAKRRKISQSYFELARNYSKLFRAREKLLKVISSLREITFGPVRVTKRNKSELFLKSKLVRICFLLFQLIFKNTAESNHMVTLGYFALEIFNFYSFLHLRMTSSKVTSIQSLFHSSYTLTLLELGIGLGIPILTIAGRGTASPTTKHSPAARVGRISTNAALLSGSKFFRVIGVL